MVTTVMASSSPTGTTVVTVAVEALSDSPRPRSCSLNWMNSAAARKNVRNSSTRSSRRKRSINGGGAPHQLARGRSEPHEVGCRPDALRLVVAVAGDAEAAREQLRAGSAGDRLGLARQQRLVELRAAGDDRSVGHHLRARAEVQQVALDDLVRADRAFDAVAHDGRLRRSERAELAQPAGGEELLDRRHRHVRDHHDPDEQPVAQFADGEQGQDHRAERDVDERQRVAADDVRVAALAGAVDVRAALCGARGRLRRAEAGAAAVLGGPGIFGSGCARGGLRHRRGPAPPAVLLRWAAERPSVLQQRGLFRASAADRVASRRMRGAAGGGGRCGASRLLKKSKVGRLSSSVGPISYLARRAKSTQVR